MKPTIKNCPMVPSADLAECVVLFHDRLLLHQAVHLTTVIVDHLEVPDPWRGYEAALATYGLYHYAEIRLRAGDGSNPYSWSFRGRRQSSDKFAFDVDMLELSNDYARLSNEWNKLRAMRMRQNIPMPPWMGNEQVHASHREWLLFKNPRYYGEVWPDEFEPMDAPEVLWT